MAQLDHRMMLQLVNLPLLLLEDLPLFSINVALLVADNEIEVAFLVSMLVNAALIGMRMSELSELPWLMKIRKTLRKLTVPVRQAQATAQPAADQPHPPHPS